MGTSSLISNATLHWQLRTARQAQEAAGEPITVTIRTGGTGSQSERAEACPATLVLG